MDTRQNTRLREWFDAESAGREDAADRACAAIMADVPRLGPSVRFVDLVMARIGVSDGARETIWANRWVRAGIAAAMVIFGLSVGTLTWEGAVDLAVGASHGAVWAAERVGTVVAAALGTVSTIWSALAHAGAVLATLLVTPGPFLMLLLNVLLAAGALAALQRLIVTQENRS